MKEKDCHIDHRHQLVLYVEKDDATFGPVQTGSYMVKNYLDDYWEKRNNLKKQRIDQLRKGEISPIAVYMAVVDIAAADLASRVGISRRKLRKHLTPAGFADMTLAMLQRYAEVFAVEPANLLQILEFDPGRIEIIFEPTAQPLIVQTRVDRREKEK